MQIIAFACFVGFAFAEGEPAPAPAPTAPADILDKTCTSGNKYTTTATVCANKYSDSACEAMYISEGEKAVEAGSDVERPWKCFKSGKEETVTNEAVKEIATKTCPKTCGYCCLSSDYNCENAPISAMNCGNITAAQCKDMAWRDVIAKNCPSACGFCNMGGCVDKVEGCQTMMCRSIGMEVFVNQFCRRTCNLCDKEIPATSTSTKTTTTTTTTTTASPSGPAPAPSPSSGSSSDTCYDAHPHCRGWVRNNFCNNSFYKSDQKKKFCAKSCGMC